MTTRKDSVRKAIADVATLSLGNIIPGFGSDSYQEILGANEKIWVGVIGVSSRGNTLVQGFAKMKGCKAIYPCDADSRTFERYQANIHKVSGHTPEGEKDIRKMLGSGDFEAVVVTTPDHWYAKAAIMTVQAEKYAYLEEPTSHNPTENKASVRATLKYNRIVQVGNQRRSWPNVIKIIEGIKSGAIEKVRYARSWYANNRPSVGIDKVVPVPDYLDWDLRQGPVPQVFGSKGNHTHCNWYWFWNWGIGGALDNGTHFVDILRWGLDVDYPTRVDFVGGRYRLRDNRQAPDTQLITFQSGGEASRSWKGRSCNSTPVNGYGIGTASYGETDILFINGGNKYKMTNLRGEVIKDIKNNSKFEVGSLPNPSGKLDAYHFEDQFNTIHEGSKLNSGIVDTYVSAQLVQSGSIAQRVGHSLGTDPGSERILNDLEANKLWGREYEKGWEIQV